MPIFDLVLLAIELVDRRIRATSRTRMLKIMLLPTELIKLLADFLMSIHVLGTMHLRTKLINQVMLKYRQSQQLLVMLAHVQSGNQVCESDFLI